MKRKAQRVAVVLTALALVTVLAHPAAACTDFILKVQGHGIVIEYVQEGLRS